MTSSLYAITVTVPGYDPEDDPDVSAADFKALPHRRLAIEAPLDEHTTSQHTPQAVRASRRYCATAMARAALSLIDQMAYASTREDYKHRCTKVHPYDEACGLHYEEGVVHVWDSGSPYVEFTVPTEYRSYWLKLARKVLADTLAADLKTAEPSKDLSGPLDTHTATTILSSDRDEGDPMSMSGDENAHITQIDNARSASLGAWAVAVAVTPEGEESFWLLSPDNEAAMGCACSTCAPHEQLGPYVVQPTTSSTEERTR